MPVLSLSKRPAMSPTKRPINSRSKGAHGEREFAKALHEELGVTLARNLEQSRQGGHDLLIVDNGHALADRLNRFAFEVKRHRQAKPGMIRQWWEQAVSQAQNADKLPALAYRADREPWRVVIPLRAVNADLPAQHDLSMAAFLDVVGFAAIVRESAGCPAAHQPIYPI